MSTPTMLAPSSAHITACDRPWPRAAPVMNTTRPSSDHCHALFRLAGGDVREQDATPGDLESYNYLSNLRRTWLEIHVNGGPRPPDGDWLGTPFLKFTRDGAFATCTLDRPAARNAMTPAMYFGIRYAISRVNADPELAGLLITGTGDVFAPGGDLGQGGEDDWMDFASTIGMDVTPFDVLRQSPKPVVAAVNGLCQGGGLQIAMCSDLAVVSDRATFRVPELFRGIADTYYSQMLARLIGPVRTKDLMFTGRTLIGRRGAGLGHGRRVVAHDDLLDVSQELLAQCCRTAPAAGA